MNTSVKIEINSLNIIEAIIDSIVEKGGPF